MIAAVVLFAASGADADATYILLDARSGRTIEARWQHAQRAVPFGSLVKPFTALAYGASHGYRYPEFECMGAGCWLPRGHGKQRLAEALANSCNSWFDQLAAGMTPEQLAPVLARFGLAEPGPDASLIGRADGWLNPPEAMARAYLELVRSPREPGVAEILRGLAMSARSGTAQGIGMALLVKTGTAPCSHGSGVGDGFAVAIDPERFVLLVGRHNATGAQTAETAGRIVRGLR